MESNQRSRQGIPRAASVDIYGERRGQFRQMNNKSHSVENQGAQGQRPYSYMGRVGLASVGKFGN
jgi:hypothetical protein